tara:strand:- start:817 stop:2358 length:1542 start_codon:yes stop_codon:yes gene_type:complete
MSLGFQTVELDPPITQTVNGQVIQYDLQYDIKNNQVRVIETGTNKANPDVIYTNGDWTKDNKLLELTELQKKQIHEDIQIAVREDYETRTGKTNEKNLPAWAKRDRQGLYASDPSAKPLSTNGEPISYNQRTGTTNIFSQGLDLVGAIWNPMATIEKDDVTSYVTANERNASTTPLMYPIDMSNLQDKMVIQCYTYRPPTAESFLSGSKEGKDNRGQILRSGLKRQSPLKYKVGGGIILPMPNTIKDASTVSWEADKLNNLAAAAAGLVSQNFLPYAVLGGGLGGKGLMSGPGQLAMQLKLLAESGQGGGLSAMSSSMISGVLNKLGFDVSPETILSRGAGVVPNSNMELMFRGPQMRQFSYNFQLTARSPEEAKVIRNIIRHLKEMSAAKKNPGAGGVAEAGDPSFFLGTPNIWTIRYVTANYRDIPGVNIIKPSALMRFETDYTPHGSWQAFDKGQPVSYKIQMDFGELEPVYNTDYNRHVAGDRVANFDDAGNQTNAGDLRKVSNDMIGY